MNHCQFLCYGLLKIFLKEAIANAEGAENLLCSYFLKTAVFWEICDKNTNWNSSYLCCFWACFRRLINWVNTGYCPNFFIPENNMFKGKIQGRAQTVLLAHLTTFYKEGYTCLLRCSSLQPLLGSIIHQPLEALSLPSETETFTSSYYSIQSISEIYNVKADNVIRINDKTFQNSVQALLFLSSQNEDQRLTLNIWRKYAVQYVIVGTSLKDIRKFKPPNKAKYLYEKYVQKNLKGYSVDLLNHHLLFGLYLYNCGFYKKAVQTLRYAKSKIQQPNMMYHWALSEDKYKAAGGDHTPLMTMLKKILADSFIVPYLICVPELKNEHYWSEFTTTLVFPPLVIVSFLLFLSHFRLRQLAEAEKELGELVLLVTYDDGHHIPYLLRAISWTVLGICQEMSGKLTDAHHSYNEALQNEHSFFKEATRIRIANLAEKLNGQ